jgi:fucose permease
LAHFLLLGIIYVSFISLGLPDGVMGAAWPAVRADFGQPLAAVGIFTLTGTVCAAAASFFAGTIVQRLGTGLVVASSCLMTGLALVGYAYVPSFAWLVVLAVPMGLGAGTVDASLNHFVAAHYSSRHMNWLHGFWGIGATAGPLIMGWAVASAAGWTLGAKTIGLLQLGLAGVLFLTLSLWAREHAIYPAEENAEGTALNESSSYQPVFKPVQQLATWLAPMTFLLYVAAEMGTGLWAASILATGRGMPLAQAVLWVSVYFGSITAGRFAVGLVANRLGNRKLVQLGIGVAALGAALFAAHAFVGDASLAGLVLMGLGCAPVFPSLMHETARRFPADVTRAVIGRQMMFSYAGGSIIPAAFGLLAAWAGLGAVMPFVVILLLILLFVTSWLDRLT